MQSIYLCILFTFFCLFFLHFYSHNLFYRDIQNDYCLKMQNKYNENIWFNFNETLIVIDGEEWGYGPYTLTGQ